MIDISDLFCEQMHNYSYFCERYYYGKKITKLFISSSF